MRPRDRWRRPGNLARSDFRRTRLLLSRVAFASHLRIVQPYSRTWTGDKPGRIRTTTMVRRAQIEDLDDRAGSRVSQPRHPSTVGPVDRPRRAHPKARPCPIPDPDAHARGRAPSALRIARQARPGGRAGSPGQSRRADRFRPIPGQVRELADPGGRKSPTPLHLFLLVNSSLPKDMRPILKTFVPKPRPLTVSSSEEIPGDRTRSLPGLPSSRRVKSQRRSRSGSVLPRP